MSLVDICNEALNSFGKKDIASLDEDTPAARYCKRFLPRVIAEIHEGYDWDHAEKRVTLTANAEELEDTPYNFVHDLPPDFARFGDVKPSGDDYRGTHAGIVNLHKRAKKTLRTSYTPIDLTYYVKDPVITDYPEHVRLAVVTRLAARICFSLTKDTRLAKTLRDEATMAYMKACDLEGQDEFETLPEGSNFRDGLEYERARLLTPDR